MIKHDSVSGNGNHLLAAKVTRRPKRGRVHNELMGTIGGGGFSLLGTRCDDAPERPPTEPPV